MYLRCIVQLQHLPHVNGNNDVTPYRQEMTMAYATETGTRAQSGLTARLFALVEGLKANAARRRVFKQTYSELASLSNRELSDLGLNRSMIRRIAWQAAYEA